MSHLNRRRFLKYAGATSAVVGASALGLDHFLSNNQLPSGKTNQTITTSVQSVRSIISTSPQFTSIAGRLFFDYNGDGVQQADEPAVPQAKVQLADYSSGKVIAESLTDSAGDYKIEDVPTGNYWFEIQADKKFSHMYSTMEGLGTVQSGYLFALLEPRNLDVGLMEGPFTLPFRRSTKYSVACYYNWDPTPGKFLWWNGRSGDNSDLVLWNNAGIDMPMDVGEDVIAPAPGRMGSRLRGPQGQLGVFLIHPDVGLGLFGTFFNHLSEVILPNGATFARGDVVAKSGTTGTKTPHLHFNNWLDFGNGTGFFDFFEPEFELTSQRSGYWYPNDTTWHAAPPTTNPNGKNLWTVHNDPHFFS